MDRQTWMEMLFYCYLQVCVPAKLLLVQKSRNRNGSPSQSMAHLAPCWLSCDGRTVTRRDGPLPLASIRTGLCMPLTWEENPSCHMAPGECVCSHPVAKRTTPNVDTGYSQRVRPVANRASVSGSLMRERSLGGRMVSPRCSVTSSTSTQSSSRAASASKRS